MPRAEEIFPLAILGTRAIGSAAQVSKKVKDFIHVSHCNNVTQLATAPMSLASDIPRRFALKS
jgi:hypothetical protein